MRRIAPWVPGAACTLVLLLVCFRQVLFEDGQFAHFDGSFFYYPLYERVQQEWAAGRWPLWDPAQNGGTPLLGNPVAAVFYPGKVLYALFPYAWGARLYVIAHTIVAFLGMVALGRTCGLSGTGSILGGLGYAFGAPVLLQYGNVIFLVGAAWLPWGLRALDRLLRQRQRCGLAELALVLALQILGGDPEAAYLTSVAGAGYGVVLVLCARRWHGRLRLRPLILAVVVAWVSVTLVLALARPALPAAPAVAIAAWGMLGAGLVGRWWRHRDEAILAPMLAGLAGACALAVALSAVQLLPMLEFALRSVRAGEAVVTNTYRFSLEPYRVIELLWPNVFGTRCPENRSWLQAILPTGDREPWVNSLYMGGMMLVLASSAAGLRGVPPWRVWLTVVAVVMLAASLGKFTSPLWWARWLPLPGLGPHHWGDLQPRQDGYLDDGTGSVYGILATLLPGFGVFRFPIKLLPFTAASLAVLAGAGWDQLAAGATERVRRLGRAGLGASLLGLALVLPGRNHAIAYLSGRVLPDPMFGPGDMAGAWAETTRALAHGAVVLAASLALFRRTPGRPRTAGTLALLLLTADLALANGGLIWTVPQAEFATPPEAARRIAAAERAHPSPGPFRIHRMPNWLPPYFVLTSVPERLREWVAWDRTTLHPLHALPQGLEYCDTQGILELDDYATFLESGLLPVPETTARVLGIPPGRPVRYYPRRGFDLWGARYFILPVGSDDWQSNSRGMASFLAETELIYPDSRIVSAQGVAPGKAWWGTRHDWQLRRNRAAYPRAWLVHHARVRPPVVSLAQRRELVQFLLFMNDPIWNDPDRPVFDLRSGAIVETDEPASLGEYLAPAPVEPSGSVTVVSHEPLRVELSAVLNRPGLVILADTYYPGWRLTIDGTPAPIFRTNRAMRGAAVRAGKHTLVYTFQPWSFRWGAIVSIAGMVVLAGMVLPLGRGRGVRSEAVASILAG